jgi:NifB/MoaA-like Fe-S oxidoreductase
MLDGTDRLMPEDDFVVVRLPKELAGRIGREMGQRFVSLDDSIVFLLERALKNETTVLATHADFSTEEKKAIEERLKSLGYS